MTTPDADAVAALAVALANEYAMWADDPEDIRWDNHAADVMDDLRDAGWTLVRDSEREALVAALEEAIEVIHAEWCTKTYHAEPCREARAAIGGRP